jgi:CBS domain-containing protein
MIAKELITIELPELTMDDSGVNALNLMDEYRVAHLPVLEGRRFLGLVSEEELLTIEHATKGLLHGNHELMNFKVQAGQHIYDVIDLVNEHRLTIVPVVDDDQRYLGSITLTCLIEGLARTQAVSDPGGIIVLSMNAHDYSLQQIAGIVESNDAKILSSTLTTSNNSSQIEVTLKINREDLNPILQTFNRYDYVVKSYYHESELSDDLKDRYEELMKYLNM